MRKLLLLILCFIGLTASAQQELETLADGCNAGSITGTLTVAAGSTTQLTDAAIGGAWSSTTTTVATVNSSTGLVTGVASGTATISYSLYSGSCYATAVVTVTAGISQISYTHAENAAGTGVGPITTPAISNVGSSLTIIVVGCEGSGSTAVTVSSSNGDAFTLINYYGSVNNIRAYKKISPTSSGSVTYSAQAASGNLYGTMSVYNLSVATDVDQINGVAGTGTASTLQPGSITPTVSGAYLIAGVVTSSIGSVTVNSAYSIDSQTPLTGGQHYQFASASQLQATAAAINPTFSFTSSTLHASLQLSVKP